VDWYSAAAARPRRARDRAAYFPLVDRISYPDTPAHARGLGVESNLSLFTLPPFTLGSAMPFSTDPKDAEVRKKGTLDCTLAVSANLVVNFHSSKPPTQAQVQFLEDALFIAKRALLAARTIVHDMRSAILSAKFSRASITEIDGELKPAIYETFTYHMHFPALTDRKDWSAWQPDLETMTEFFAADCQYLFGRPVVGDTIRLVLKPAYAVVTNKELQKKITGDGTASEGFVNLKKSAWAKIDQKPELFEEWVGGSYKFQPEEWGNIKVDFALLSKVPRLQIAGTLIHESTHKMKNAVDHCYASSTGAYKSLTKAQAMDNADSYAFVAISLYKMAYIKNDNALKLLGSTKAIDTES
jgi:hypothetical protein